MEVSTLSLCSCLTALWQVLNIFQSYFHLFLTKTLVWLLLMEIM